MTAEPTVRPEPLRRLISIDLDTFAEEYWGRQPLLCPANESGQDFADLFSLGAADELVAERGIRTPFVRMANEGTVLATSRYTGGGGFGAEIGDQLDPAKVLHEFAGGSTLVLQALHRTWAPIAEFTRQLVGELAHPAQVNAYVTPASSRGFDPHYDVHDVFVIQIHGQKRWRIHRPVHEIPLDSQPWTEHRDAVATAAEDEPVLDVVLNPGDVLYLPRGWIHSATALGGTSIHLTVGVAPLTRWDLVQQLLADADADADAGAGAADDVELRRALPLGFDWTDAAAVTPIVAETITAIVAKLAAAAARPDRLGGALARQLADSMPPAPVAPLATIDALESIEAASVVVWRHGQTARVEFDADDGVVRIVLPTRTVALPAQATPAIRSLAVGRPRIVGALAGLDAASAVAVARRLVREGVLVLC